MKYDGADFSFLSAVLAASTAAHQRMPVLTISKAHAAPEVSDGEAEGVWRGGIWKRERGYEREREGGEGGRMACPAEGNGVQQLQRLAGMEAVANAQGYQH